MKKRIICLLLCAVTLLPSLTAPVSAAPAAESSGDQQSVGLGLAGGRRHGAGEFFRGDLKVHLRLQSCPDDG